MLVSMYGVSAFGVARVLGPSFAAETLGLGRKALNHEGREGHEGQSFGWNCI